MENAWIPNLFVDQESSDVQLCIDTSDGDDQAVFPVHSLILRSASKVFRTMLDTANFKEGQTRTVELKAKGSMDDAICFLRCLYTRELAHLDLSVYISVLQTAHLYEVDALVKLCNVRNVGDVTPLNVCQAYRQLKNVASEELLSYCKDFMLEFAFLIFRKALHLSLDEKTMSFLLASDKLNVQDEEQALGALWRWGCARRALENNLGISIELQIKDLSLLIRRPLMKTIPENSPWFCLLQRDMAFAGTGPPDSSTANPVENRKPCVRNDLNRFSEVARFPKLANGIGKIPLGNTIHPIMMFSFDRCTDILLSGLTMQITTREILDPLNIFQFFVNNDDITNVVYLEVTQTHFYNGPQWNINNFMYDLTVSLRTPVTLKQAEPNLLKMKIKEAHECEVSLTAYNFPVGSTLPFNKNLIVRVWDKQVAVTQLYYFL